MRYAPNQKIGKPNNLKVFGSKKTKGPKQGSQIILKLHVPEGSWYMNGLWMVVDYTCICIQTEHCLAYRYMLLCFKYKRRYQI